MKLTSHKRTRICGAYGLLVAVLLQTASAQDDSPYQAKTFEGSSTQSTGRPRGSNATYGLPTNQPRIEVANPFWANSAINQPRPPALGPEFEKAAEAVREAEDDTAKSKAEEHLRDLLTKYFGEDMKSREAELKKMEKRLKKLQEQLALRSEKRDEIVDLQMKVLINQANGLGFFSNGPASDTQPTQNSYWYYSSPQPTYAPQPAATPAVPAEQSAPPRATRAAPVAPPTDRYEPRRATRPAQVAPPTESDTSPQSPSETPPVERDIADDPFAE